MSSQVSPFVRRQVADHYDDWYLTCRGQRVDLEEKNLFLKLVAPQRESSLLDIGCGSGHFSFWFHQLGFKVTGIDNSSSMLTVALRKVENEEIKFIQADAHDLPFLDDSFNLAVLVTTLEFLDHPEVALKEAFRVAREGVFLGVLGRWSFLALIRRLRGLFRDSVYRKARFYSLRELKSLARKCAPNSFEVSQGKTLRGAFVGVMIRLKCPKG